MAFEIELGDVERAPALRRLDMRAKRALGCAAMESNPADTIGVGLPEPNLDKAERRAERIERELARAVGAWQQYSELIRNVPTSIDDLQRHHPNFDTTIDRLYDAKEFVDSQNIVARSSVPMHDELEPVIIPWQALYEDFDTYFRRVARLRVRQGVTSRSDEYSQYYHDMIRKNEPFCRNPMRPDQLLAPRDYLYNKLISDGPWGVMLMQTGVYPHCREWPSMTADDATNTGQSHLRVGDIPIDHMGIFEWVALTLQVSPRRSAMASATMLLGNRFTIEGRDFVPRTDTRGNERLVISRMTADMNYSARPRWAIA